MADSGLVFDPITGLVAPDTEVIRAAVAADWVKAFAAPDQPLLDTDATTPAGQLIDSETAIIEDKNAQILYLANMFNPAVADGRWQDALGCDYQLYLELNNIEHTKTKARHPRTNGIRERFHKTVLRAHTSANPDRRQGGVERKSSKPKLKLTTKRRQNGDCQIRYELL